MGLDSHPSGYRPDCLQLLFDLLAKYAISSNQLVLLTICHEVEWTLTNHYFFLSPLCALSLSFSLVTLLDTMSALGDLGWEAYPAEGVSNRTNQNQDTNAQTSQMSLINSDSCNQPKLWWILSVPVLHKMIWTTLGQTFFFKVKMNPCSWASTHLWTPLAHFFSCKQLSVIMLSHFRCAGIEYG